MSKTAYWIIDCQHTNTESGHHPFIAACESDAVQEIVRRGRQGEVNPLHLATAVAVSVAATGALVLLAVHAPVVAALVVSHAAVLVGGYAFGRPQRMELHMCQLQLDDQRQAAAVLEAGAGVIAPERPERCESCTQPATVHLEDGSHWCRECDGSARRLGYDDPEPEPWVLDPPYLREREVGA